MYIIYTYTLNQLYILIHIPHILPSQQYSCTFIHITDPILYLYCPVFINFISVLYSDCRLPLHSI